MAPRKIGPFEVDRQIGIGGMGIVYSAVYPENGKKVALKVLSPGLTTDRKIMKRFEREIEILKRLDHPNIVKYFGGGTENGQRYYAMEFIDGGSLQDKLNLKKTFSWKQALHVGRQVASALEHAHNAGIIHRDLKPANLFLSKKGRLKLGDFGIARDTEATQLTAAGKTVGTYAYMAPEQIQATHPITRKTDLYALGCLLYEVLVGETPFLADSNNPMDMLMQHLNDDPYNVSEKVSNCPPALDALVERLLAKNPDDRPYDALAVHTELGEIRDAIAAGHSISLGPTVVDTEVPAATKESETQPTPKKKKKKKKKGEPVPFHERTWFLVSSLLLLVAAAYYLSRPPNADELRTQWQAEMAKGDKESQNDAVEIIDDYLKHYPDGEHVAEAMETSEEVQANKLEKATKNRAKKHQADPGKPEYQPESPLEAACYKCVTQEDEEGLYYRETWTDSSAEELSANPLPAMQRWAAVIRDHSPTVDADDKKSRGLNRLCRNHYDFFRRKLIQSDDAPDYFRDRMKDAEELGANGKTDKAREIWSFVVEAFGEVAKFRTFTEYARRRLSGAEVTIPGVSATPDETDATPKSDS